MTTIKEKEETFDGLAGEIKGLNNVVSMPSVRSENSKYFIGFDMHAFPWKTIKSNGEKCFYMSQLLCKFFFWKRISINFIFGARKIVLGSERQQQQEKQHIHRVYLLLIFLSLTRSLRDFTLTATHTHKQANTNTQSGVGWTKYERSKSEITKTELRFLSNNRCTYKHALNTTKYKTVRSFFTPFHSSCS